MDAAPFQTYLTKEWKVFKVFKGEQLYRLPEPPVGRRNPLQGYLRLLQASSERHQGLSEAILTGKGSISDFFPVPPAHH